MRMLHCIATAGALLIYLYYPPCPSEKLFWLVFHWGLVFCCFCIPSHSVRTVMTAYNYGHYLSESSSHWRVRLITSKVSVIWMKLSAYDTCWLHENATGRFSFSQNLSKGCIQTVEHLNVEWWHWAHYIIFNNCAFPDIYILFWSSATICPVNSLFIINYLLIPYINYRGVHKHSTVQWWAYIETHKSFTTLMFAK